MKSGRLGRYRSATPPASAELLWLRRCQGRLQVIFTGSQFGMVTGVCMQPTKFSVCNPEIERFAVPQRAVFCSAVISPSTRTTAFGSPQSEVECPGFTRYTGANCVGKLTLEIGRASCRERG